MHEILISSSSVTVRIALAEIGRIWKGDFSNKYLPLFELQLEMQIYIFSFINFYLLTFVLID